MQIRRATLVAFGASLLVLGSVAADKLPAVRFPPTDIGVDTLAERAAKQLKTKDQFKVFNDFRFQDRIKESGIGFVHHIVEDAGVTYKAVHYDHGNGIAVADVDGDGLSDIYFLNQVGGNQLWRNIKGGRFEEITESAGVALKDRISVAGSFADTDNDGDQDLFVTTVRMGNVLFRNDGKGHFTDISKEAKLDYVGHSSGAVFFDYNKDGLLDLFLANVGRYTNDKRNPSGAFVGLEDAFGGHLHPDRTEASILYRNTGSNHFTNVSSEVGLGATGWNGDASASDVNGDGWPDLYVLNMQGDNHYLENVGGKSFVDKTSERFPKTPWGAMGIKFFDYDNDGLQDLLLTDMHSDMSEEIGPEREKLKSRMKWDSARLGGGANSIFGNAFYRNLGKGKYEEISDRLGVENYWPWGVSVGDLNADGYEDVFITSSMNYPFRYGVNTLLLNNLGQKFLDSEFILGVEPRRDGRTHTRWFEVDCATPEDKRRFACKDQTGHVEVWATLASRSSAMFDLDEDGDLDIVTNDFGSEPMVLVSDLSQRKAIHFLKVKLVGAASNRNGLGAVVTAHVGPRSYMRVNDGKSGYLSQSDLPLYLGLGDGAKVDRIDVTWPSGKKQTVTSGIPMNAAMVITEPK